MMSLRIAGDSLVGDIEDSVSPEHPVASLHGQSKNGILPRALRNKRRSHKDSHKDEQAQGDSFLPGSHFVYIKTWGCSHNTSDGEYMAGLLAASGYTIVDSPLQAHLWLLNSCTVKGPSEDGFKNSVSKGRELGKAVVVAGCVPQGQKTHPAIQGLSVVGVQHIDRVVEVVEETLKGNVVHLFSQRKEGGKRVAGPSLDLPKIRKNHLVEIIPINSGCLNHCTYCKTKHARGNLASYEHDEILGRAKQAFSEGVVELWLTSEDTGAYGRDIGTSLPELLNKLVCVIPDNCMMRIGMTNPPYILEHLKDMADILNHPRVYSFLHIPVQSGSDAVLGDMKREYSVADFVHVVEYLRERVPNVTIATDIICGFPTETKEDFEETMDLVREYKFPSLFINQFYPRPGTPAAKMKRIPTQEVKRRSRTVSQIFQSYQTYDWQMGKKERVLITEEAHDGVHYVGHNKSYDQVLVRKEDGLMGKMVEVEIVTTGKHYLIGRLVDTPTLSTGMLSTPPSVISTFSSSYTASIKAKSPVPSFTKTDISLLVLLLALVLAVVYLRTPSFSALY